MMRNTNFLPGRLQTARILMIAAILLIVAFQSYWVRRLYTDEKAGLKKEANTIFRDVVYNLQAERFRSDSLVFRTTTGGPNIFVHNVVNALRTKVQRNKKDSLPDRIADSIKGIALSLAGSRDTSNKAGRLFIRRGPLPEAVEELISKSISQGTKVVIADTAMRRLQGKMGVRIMVSGNSKPPDSLLEAISNRVAAPANIIIRGTPASDTLVKRRNRNIKRDSSFDFAYSDKAIVRMLTTGKAIDDSLSLSKLDSAYRRELARNNIALGFVLHSGRDDSSHRKDTLPGNSFATRPASVGFLRPYWYQAELANPATLLARKMTPQVLFSVFLVAFTSLAFIFLYRNLAQQRRLTEMKNDFISNITHELKTPIATVSVAVEALRNFGGMQNPERTKEYLDISAAELQRLGLLVDKVLKLSLFENRELELKREPLDLYALLQEVLNTMRLQFDKQHARVDISVQGSYFTVNADRLHITSVVYNLLDNALKYSTGKPDIHVCLTHDTDMLTLSVSDKGLGIPAAYQQRVFEKFFRVPSGDHHNIKGYGLGLSYVAHVVGKHGGSISVTSEEGKGSTFTVKLPIA